MIQKFNSFTLPLVIEEVSASAASTETSAAGWSLPFISINGIPQSICDEIRVEATSIVTNENAIVTGPNGSHLYFIANDKKPVEPYTVVVDVKKTKILCRSESCTRFRTFNVCCHVMTIAFRIEVFDQYVSKMNETKAKQLITKAVNTQKEKGAGKKKHKATQKRKAPANFKAQKITMIAEAESDDVLPLDRTQSCPKYPDPPSNGYVVGILRYCHKKVSTCYGCGSKFQEDSYPKPPQDLVVVSKTQRMYVDPKTRKRKMSDQLSNVYFHFNYACVSNHDPLFTPQLLHVPKDLRPHLLPEHKATLDFSQVLY